MCLSSTVGLQGGDAAKGGRPVPGPPSFPPARATRMTHDVAPHQALDEVTPAE